MIWVLRVLLLCQLISEVLVVLLQLPVPGPVMGMIFLFVTLLISGSDYSGMRLAGRPQKEAPDSAFLQAVIPTGHGYSIDRPWLGVAMRDGWKYVALEGQSWMLYNLNEDPYEQANLAHNSLFKAERKRLQDRLAQWTADTGDEFELPEL